MRKKKSTWKKIRPYVLAELLVVAVILLAARIFWNDAEKSVRLEINSCFEGLLEDPTDESDGLSYTLGEWKVDVLAGKMGRIPKRLAGGLHSTVDHDYDGCIGVGLLCDYATREYDWESDSYYTEGEDECIFLNGTVALLTVSTISDELIMDGPQRIDKITWDLTGYFDMADIRAVMDRFQWTPMVDEVYGHETADGHLVPTKITFRGGVDCVLQSREYREDDVRLAKAETDSEGEVYFLEQPAGVCALVEALAKGDFPAGDDDRYFCRTETGSVRVIRMGDDDWYDARHADVISCGNKEIHYSNYSQGDTSYYIVIDFGTVVWRKAGRKTLALALFVQVATAVAMVIRFGVDRKNRQLKQLRDTFINAMAHELKTPAAVVRNTAEYLATGAKPEKQEHYLNVLVRESESMNEKLGRMLTYTRVMDDTLVIEHKATDWNKMADDVLASYEDLIASKGMKVVFEERTFEIPGGDPALMGMVIDNLIGNAVRYGEPDSTIIVRTEEKRFSVWNKTEPLSEEELAGIWTPMFQTDRRKADSETGGMGLAISAGILDRHDADYGVRNEGDGLLFWFDFSKARDTEKLERWSWGSVVTSMINLLCAALFGFQYASDGSGWHIALECLWLVCALFNVFAFAANYSGKWRKKKKKLKTA